MVAQLRGAEFEDLKDVGYHGLQPKGGSDIRMSKEAMTDVIDWLGYKESGDYFMDLPIEQKNIFKRGTS